MSIGRNKAIIIASALVVLLLVVVLLIVFMGGTHDTENVSPSTPPKTEPYFSSSVDTTSQTSSERASRIAQSVAGLEKVEDVGEEDLLSIGAALDTQIGSTPLDSLSLSVTEVDKPTDAENSSISDQVFYVHDNNTNKDYSVVHTPTGWYAVPQQYSQAYSNASSSASKPKEEPKQTAADLVDKDQLSVQNNWVPVSNFDNSNFDVSNAVSFADEVGLSSVLSQDAIEAIESGVGQMLTENDLTLSSSASLFVERTSVKEADNLLECKLLVHHSGGHTVLLCTFDAASNGVYLDLFGQDKKEDNDSEEGVKDVE